MCTCIHVGTTRETSGKGSLLEIRGRERVVETGLLRDWDPIMNPLGPRGPESGT